MRVLVIVILEEVAMCVICLVLSNDLLRPCPHGPIFGEETHICNKTIELVIVFI